MDLQIAGVPSIATAEQGEWLTFKRVDNGEPALNKFGKPLRMLLAGSESERYQKAMRAAVAHNVAMNKGRRKNAEPTEDDIIRSAESQAKQQITVLSKVALDWDGFVLEDETPIAFSESHAAELFKNWPSLREQADEFVNEKANFLPKQ